MQTAEHTTNICLIAKTVKSEKKIRDYLIETFNTKILEVCLGQRVFKMWRIIFVSEHARHKLYRLFDGIEINYYIGYEEKCVQK